MIKTITKTDCMKNGYVCEFYPSKFGLEPDEENEGEFIQCEFHPDTYKIKEVTRPDCYYCNRAKDKIKKDRYK